MSFLNLHQPKNDHSSLSSSLLLSSLHNAEQRVFSCSYCSRKFYSPQAFGGHQNAHKLERTLAKKSRELSSAARHQPEWNCVLSGSGFDSYGSTHVAQVQPPMVVGIQHHVEYGYKGENVDQDSVNHLDLSLRL
ncbi:hypothetical protein L1987_27982 [Smallanthus sonchifolius]|uniref:Uncharacterized protein n=1 Tax=Smallanthus sonchifolius TaxID=185202 RepID=A0ACB9IEL6_9ASTR|nr:hypothetical protein L1987_27982 [Smallanthus sonchifolius]